MTIFLFVITFFFFCLLVIVAAMHPHHSVFSSYELKRRVENGDRTAKDTLYQQVHRRDIESLLQLKIMILIIVTSFLLVATFGWVIGIVLIIVVLLIYNAVGRAKFIHRIAAKLYGRLEPKLFGIADRIPRLTSFIRLANGSDVTVRLGSRQELEHLVHNSEGILSPEEEKIVINSLTFSDKRVSDIMTPVDSIVSVKKAEFLGPLTLDELHQSGHSHLPVIGQDINQVVGILYLDTLLALDVKRSMTAEKAMDPRVLYVRQDQTLSEILAALLRTHHHLFIVVNHDKETVGLVTLSDVMQALLGQKIIDELDDHESIRAVAERSSYRKHDEA